MKGLVSDHLERVSFSAFEKFPSIASALVGKRHGVYALYKGDKLYYVGLAKDLKTRLKQHLRDQHAKRWDRFSLYLTHTDEHLKELETLVVHIAKPKGNVQVGKFVRSRNLQPELKKLLAQKVDGMLANIENPLKKKKSASKPKGSPKKPGLGPQKKPGLSGLLMANSQLKVKYKGEEYFATVGEDGRIILDGIVFNAPSTAAKHITGKAVDGWHFWKYQQEDDQWVRIDELRKKI